MCGIAGFHGIGSKADLEGMTNALTHRGPDASGYHVNEENALYLGHRRLSILDIAGGAQPMWSYHNKICVVFNGEIYNFQELRTELEQKGHRFQSDHSDTETLIYGYLEWGERLPEYLNGMFAFCIWDIERNQLFLARDRFGEKPLYWAQQGDLFAFGSELSVFKHHHHFSVCPNRLALKKLFAYGFIPAPLSFYKDVNKLPAGSRMTYCMDSRKVDISSYWQYSISAQENRINDNDAAEELLALLDKAVQRRMVSDVPLGIFLSGGIDSSTVAALACRHAPQNSVKTFSIGFDEPSYDESAYAQQMADYLKTDHTCEIFNIEKLLQLAPEILGQLDEPMGDPSLMPTFALAKMTRKHVTVALSGDGGDELLAGYDTFAALKMAEKFERFIPNILRKATLRLVDLMPKSDRNMSLDYKLSRALGGIGHGPALWNPQWLSPASKEMITDLFNEETSIEDLYGDAITHWNNAPSSNLVDRSSEYYVRFYLQDDILTKVDRAAMLNSLETRAVFLDNDVIDFISTLPADLKLRDGIRKFILKKALAKVIPQNILDRPKKGFGIPLADWTRQLELSNEGLSRFGLNTDKAAIWKNKHQSKRKDYRLFLWNWYVLQNHII